MSVLEDGNFVLYESRAIARYLAGLAGSLPTDPKKLALLDQAISVEVSNFNSSASAIAFQKVFEGSELSLFSSLPFYLLFDLAC
jgi:glutathione S-transferase